MSSAHLVFSLPKKEYFFFMSSLTPVYFYKKICSKDTVDSLIKMVSYWNVLFTKHRNKEVLSNSGCQIHGWNFYYRGTVVLLDFIHNPVRSIGTRKVVFRVPMEYLGMWQIVSILRLGSENDLIFIKSCKTTWGPGCTIFFLWEVTHLKCLLQLFFYFSNIKNMWKVISQYSNNDNNI